MTPISLPFAPFYWRRKNFAYENRHGYETELVIPAHLYILAGIALQHTEREPATCIISDSLATRSLVLATVASRRQRLVGRAVWPIFTSAGRATFSLHYHSSACCKKTWPAARCRTTDRAKGVWKRVRTTASLRPGGREWCTIKKERTPPAKKNITRSGFRGAKLLQDVSAAGGFYCAP